jgi:predicted Fe-Mo cluster-binding NifX family protein
MIVTIPVDGKVMDAKINRSFGRAPYFLVYDTEKQTGSFLENAADVLKSSGIKLYMASSQSIQDNINNFISGKLSTLTEIHAGFNKHGG